MLPYTFTDANGEIKLWGRVETSDDIDALTAANAGLVFVPDIAPNPNSYRYYAVFPGDTYAWVLRPERSADYEVWDYVGNFWYDPRPLAERRDLQWGVIQVAQAAADAEDLEWSGSTFQVDVGSRDKIKEALLDSILATLASEAWSIEWTLADNSTLTMSAADMASMSRALAARTNDNHDKAQDKRALIYASMSPEDITWDSVP